MTTATQETNSDIETRLVHIETRLDSMATKEDLANFTGEIRTEMATRFGEQDAKMEARFGEQDTKMEARFGELETRMATNQGELKTEIANLRTEVIRWTVGSIAISTTVVVSVVTLVQQLSG